jgi:hypothetical protein
MTKSVEINNHRVEGEEWNVNVTAVGNLTPGNAYARYDITGFNSFNNEFNVNADGSRLATERVEIVFQSGRPVPDALVGVTMESLLAVCEHRLSMLQEGQFPCYENAEALKGVTKALTALKGRTIRQIAMAEAAAKRGEEPTPKA